MTTKKRVAILASGSGSNAQALMEAMQAEDFPAEATLLFSDKAGAYALERAKALDVMTLYLDPSGYASREDFDGALLRVLQNLQIEIVCMAGYMRIVSAGLVEAYQGRMLNVHPSLLPKFGGPGMFGHHVHAAVLKAGEKESGATIHLVSPEVDQGEILLQARVPILEGDDLKSLSARILEQEHRLYPQALRQVAEKLS
jgi:phosphoribosylglycinamide formyltransferase-1